MGKKKIYCAGPLFNTKEKEEMQEIAMALEDNKFDVFLPQRDGFEFAYLSQAFSELGILEKDANTLLKKAIFALDVFQVLDSDGLVLNMNGRVPDEGALVEAGIAWSAGKRLVIYKNDERSLIDGNDNPLALGLSDFVALSEISSIPKAFQELFSKDSADEKTIIDNSNLKQICDKGARLFSLAKNSQDKHELCYKLIEIVGE